MSATLASLDLEGILRELTGLDGWEEAEGPDSGVGVDYWYVREASGHGAYVNLDQSNLTVSVTRNGDEAEGPEFSLTLDIEEPDPAYAGFVSRSVGGPSIG